MSKLDINEHSKLNTIKKSQLNIGQKVFLNYKGSIRRYVYDGYKTSGFHILHAYSRTLVISDDILKLFIIPEYIPNKYEKIYNDMLDLITFDSERRLLSVI